MFLSSSCWLSKRNSCKIQKSKPRIVPGHLLLEAPALLVFVPRGMLSCCSACLHPSPPRSSVFYFPNNPLCIRFSLISFDFFIFFCTCRTFCLRPFPDLIQSFFFFTFLLNWLRCMFRGFPRRKQLSYQSRDEAEIWSNWPEWSCGLWGGSGLVGSGRVWSGRAQILEKVYCRSTAELLLAFWGL